MTTAPGLTIVRFHKLRHTHGRDEDVRAPAMPRDVARAGVADRDGGVGVFLFLAEQRGHRFAHNIPAAQHDHLRARAMLTPERTSNSRMPAGVQGTNPLVSPSISLPMFTG